HNAAEFDLTGVHHRDLARLLISPIHKFTGRKHYRACKRGHQILLLGGEPGKNGHLSHTVGFMLMSLWQCQGTHTHNVPGPTESNQLDERQGNAGSAAIPCRYIPKPGANLETKGPIMTATTNTHTILRAEGFSCPSCVNKIEKRIGRLKGVDNVKVHFASARIEIDHNESEVGVDE